MRADKALERSGANLIAAETLRGMVVVHHSVGEKRAFGGDFQVRFVPRNIKGELDGEATVKIGSYDDLDTAITIAALSHGISDTGWKPVKADMISILLSS